MDGHLGGIARNLQGCSSVPPSPSTGDSQSRADTWAAGTEWVRGDRSCRGTGRAFPAASDLCSCGTLAGLGGRLEARAASEPFLRHHHHQELLARGAATEPACPGTPAWSTVLASTSPRCGSGRCCSRPPSPRCPRE